MIFFRLLRIISHVRPGWSVGVTAHGEKREGEGGREKKKYIDTNLAEELLQQRFSKNILFKLNECLFLKNATTRREGCLPVSVFLSFFIYLSPCSVSSLSSQMCRASCPFQGRSLACCFFFATPSPSQFLRLPLFISLLLSLVMSLSRCESLGYQCSASDRKRMINKLSCFSSPLYPPPFFFF